jgi:hypothetical protein
VRCVFPPWVAASGLFVGTKSAGKRARRRVSPLLDRSGPALRVKRSRAAKRAC